MLIDVCRWMFTGANAATDKQTLRLADERVAQIKEPAALTGQVDRKAAGFSLGVGSGWKYVPERVS